MSSQTVYFVTGANRGIGRAFVERYLLQPSSVVIAGVRNVSKPDAQSLSSLPTASNSKLITAAIGDTSKDEGINQAVAELQSYHSIDHIDIVVANAGMSDFTTCAPLHSLPISDLEKHVQVNSFGTVRLYQAAYPLLKAAHTKYGREPKFVAISALLGTMAYMDAFAFPQLSYCVSKTALNWLVRAMQRETSWLCAFPLHPGWVQTDMGQGGADSVGVAEAPTTVEESVVGMIRVVSKANLVVADGSGDLD
ncbi:MAG: hypothetical protein M1822_001536 [Bathelium mastoideum]|nr:MAG: hypothetical protein M1822_001536 [Bathelium mastoideum]